MVHDCLAAGRVEHARAQADEAARRDLGLDVHALAARVDLEDLGAALAEQFQRRPHPAERRVEHEPLEGFARHAVDLLLDDLRLAHGQFEALAAHVLDEDAQVQQAAARDVEFVARVAHGHLQRHVLLELLLQAIPDLAAGDVLPLAAAERTVVDAEDHVQRGFVDLHALHRQRLVMQADRVADLDVGDALDRAEVTGFHELGGLAAQALEALDARDAAALDAAILLGRDDRQAGLDRALVDAADRDAAHVVVVVEVRHQELQRLGRIAGRGRHAVVDRLEEIGHPALAVVAVEGGPAIAAAGEEHREVERQVIGAQLDQQVEDLVHDRVGAALGAVALVDDHDRLQADLERLLQHEARLRHGALERVDQQQAAVGHAQHALDLAAEVGVARGVDDVHADALALVRPLGHHVVDGTVLGQDRDPALALERVRIHDALAIDLARRARGVQHGVDEGGLAVVDVGDDGDVADG